MSFEQGPKVAMAIAGAYGPGEALGGDAVGSGFCISCVPIGEWQQTQGFCVQSVMGNMDLAGVSVAPRM